jgi:hypothetical protein
MERREFIALLGAASAMLPSPARADQAPAPDSLAAKLVGTWSFVSAVNRRKDGSLFDRWGANPKGILMFDQGGRYSHIVVGSESRVFGVKTYCAFGSYTVDEIAKSIVTQIEGCSISRRSGSTQSRQILLLTADELKYTNSIPASDFLAEVAWKRVG